MQNGKSFSDLVLWGDCNLKSKRKPDNVVTLERFQAGENQILPSDRVVSPAVVQKCHVSTSASDGVSASQLHTLHGTIC